MLTYASSVCGIAGVSEFGEFGELKKDTINGAKKTAKRAAMMTRTHGRHIEFSLV